MLEDDQFSFEQKDVSKTRVSNRSERFWDRIARKYSLQPIKDIEAYEFKLEKTQSYFPPGAVILEFGCGTGLTALNHATKVDHVLAIDTAPNMIQIARENLEKTGLDNVTFENASINDVSNEDHSFDVVLGLNVLHLLPEPEAAILEVRKLLKPDGVFILSTHCVADKTPWVRRLVPLGQFLNIMPFVNVFSKTDLKKWLSNAEFVVDFQWAAANSPSTFFLISKINSDQLPSIEGEVSGAQNA